MKFENIPDLIEVTKVLNTPNAVSIWYSIDGRAATLIVFKKETDPHWKLMEGKTSQYRGMLAVIAEEQRLWGEKKTAESLISMSEEKMNMIGKTGTAFFSPLHR